METTFNENEKTLIIQDGEYAAVLDCSRIEDHSSVGKFVVRVVFGGQKQTWTVIQEENTELYAAVQSVVANHPELVVAYADWDRTEEEAKAAIRNNRDQKLADCDYIFLRHRDEKEMGISTTLTEEQYQQWLVYRQALRDITTQDGYPWLNLRVEDVPWPTQPK